MRGSGEAGESAQAFKSAPATISSSRIAIDDLLDLQYRQFAWHRTRDELFHGRCRYRLRESRKTRHDLAAAVIELADQLPALQVAAVGVIIILFLLFEPRGLDRVWRRVKDYFACWPFRY